MFKFENGQAVKDIITGFKGVIMGRADYLTGCNRYAISPQKLTKEGKRPEWEWIDEDRLQYNGKKVSLNRGRLPGFDGNDPDNKE